MLLFKIIFNVFAKTIFWSRLLQNKCKGETDQKNFESVLKSDIVYNYEMWNVLW